MEERETKKEEREKKKQVREKERERERRKNKRRRRKSENRNLKKRQAKASGNKKSASVTELQDSFSNLVMNESENSGDKSEADCPGCGLVYGSADGNEKWVQCDECEAWWVMTCAGVDKKTLP